MVELLAIIKAVEHQRARKKSLWTRLTVPDYTGIIIERLQTVVGLITKGEA